MEFVSDVNKSVILCCGSGWGHAMHLKTCLTRLSFYQARHMGIRSGIGKEDEARDPGAGTDQRADALLVGKYCATGESQQISTAF